MLLPASLHGAIRGIMADAADRAIMPRFGRLAATDMHEKEADEQVTVADRESEQILADGLHRLLPDAKIVGEEAAHADPTVLNELGGELCWIIDPLDGTGNFAEGKGPFGILVALAERGSPIGGWIFDPRSRRFCAASRESGAFIDGEPVRVRSGPGSTPVVAISSLLARTSDGRALVGKIERSFATMPIPRCAAEQYPRMVLGKSDITLYGRTLPWDHAAGVLFLAEAGGIATRFDGSPYRVDDDRQGLVAAVSEELWEMAMAAMDREA